MIWCLSRRQNSLKEDILIGRHGKMTLMLWEMCKMLVIFNNFCKRHRLQMFRFLDVWKTILNIYISYHSAIFMLDILVNNQPNQPRSFEEGRNLQGIMFHLFIFRGIKTFGESPLLWCKQTCSTKNMRIVFSDLFLVETANLPNFWLVKIHQKSPSLRWDPSCTERYNKLILATGCRAATSLELWWWVFFRQKQSS